MSNCKFVRKWTTVIVRVNGEAGLLGPARDGDRQPTRQEDLGKVPGIEWSVVHGSSALGNDLLVILSIVESAETAVDAVE